MGAFHAWFVASIWGLVNGLKHRVTFGASYKNTALKLKKHLILGSGSKSRYDILSAEGFDITVIKPDIDEKALGFRGDGSNASELVTLIATAKADAILLKLKNQMEESFKDKLVLTADQVVVHKGKILEKPRNLEEARAFMQSYRNSSCSTVGSLVLSQVSSGRRLSTICTASIFFGDIPEETIEAILAEGEVLQCAGGLMVEHPLVQPHIVRQEGSQESLMGLCTASLQSLLSQFDIPAKS